MGRSPFWVFVHCGAPGAAPLRRKNRRWMLWKALGIHQVHGWLVGPSATTAFVCASGVRARHPHGLSRGHSASVEPTRVALDCAMQRRSTLALLPGCGLPDLVVGAIGDATVQQAAVPGCGRGALCSACRPRIPFRCQGRARPVRCGVTRWSTGPRANRWGYPRPAGR